MNAATSEAIAQTNTCCIEGVIRAIKIAHVVGANRHIMGNVKLCAAPIRETVLATGIKVHFGNTGQSIETEIRGDGQNTLAIDTHQVIQLDRTIGAAGTQVSLDTYIFVELGATTQPQTHVIARWAIIIIKIPEHGICTDVTLRI